MSIMRHENLTGSDIHHPFKWIVEDESERNGLTNIQEGDLYSLCLQKDDCSVWMLINSSPVTWKLL